VLRSAATSIDREMFPASFVARVEGVAKPQAIREPPPTYLRAETNENLAAGSQRVPNSGVR
jgi:hypothetical protein